LTEGPFLVVIAGPNGSGKSTLTKSLLDSGVDLGIYINPDEIAQTLDLPEPLRTKQAQEIADFKRETCLRRKESFSFETVMSHQSKIELMIRAHDAGYDITLFFVATSDPEINVRRVENRVAQGGHDVPTDRIGKRYWRSLGFLTHAALVARRTVAFDNSALVGSSPQLGLVNARAGLRPVAEVTRNGNHYDIAIEPNIPPWATEHLITPMESVARASEGTLTVAVQEIGDLG
jgi:predicted ABC-type ATPase